ncbi:MAG: hypothetical protein KG012_19445 [Deltaproteobacteria bacterium]|nr:hypothetical protein [Deltaproteobacteria bacterium]
MDVGGWNINVTNPWSDKALGWIDAKQNIGAGKDGLPSSKRWLSFSLQIEIDEAEHSNASPKEGSKKRIETKTLRLHFIIGNAYN